MTSYGQMQEEKQEECIKFSLSVYESLSDDVSLIVNWSSCSFGSCGFCISVVEEEISERPGGWTSTCDQLEYRDCRAPR